MPATLDRRAALLALAGAHPAQIDELLRYTENRFRLDDIADLRFPLGDEPFVAEWETYATAVREAGTLTAIFPFLPELQFPLEHGLRDQPDYRAAMQGHGIFPSARAPGLDLALPDRASLYLHASPAGRIPVLLAGCREDFARLVCAFTRKGEPEAIPPAMGALIVGGYVNRPRLLRLRQQFFLHGGAAADWPAAWLRLKEQKGLYQDRFILLSPGPYSGVPAAALGLSEPDWLQTSLALRLEHECAHYVTRRILGSMNGNLLDELLADFRALRQVTGAYPLHWARSFLGLEQPESYRAGGRLENYTASSPLSPDAFAVLVRLVRDATATLARFSEALAPDRCTARHDVASLLAIAALTLEELAAPEAVDILTQTLEARLRAWAEPPHHPTPVAAPVFLHPTRTISS